MLFSVSVSVISVLSVFVGNLVCSIFHFESSPEWLVNGFSLLVAVISAVTAYISSNDKLCQNLDLWVRFRVASEKLKSEYALYQGRCGDYNIPGDHKDAAGHTAAEKRFRENVESIVQEANDNFTKIFQNGNGNSQPNPEEQHHIPAAPKPVAPPQITELETKPETKPENVSENVPEDAPGGYGDDKATVSDEQTPPPISDDEFAEADSLG